jgi:hypothetical protein
MTGQPRTISLFATTGVRLDVRQDPDGSVVFLGSDVDASLRGYDYEYTVSADQVPSLRKQLGGGEDADVLALINTERDAILAHGEITWLRERGIEGTLHSAMHT